MLTESQLAARRGKLTASRIAVLMNGDAAGIMRIWRELTGQATADDIAREQEISESWPVQLGVCTEQLNLDRFEKKNSPVTRRGDVVTHAKYPWAAATLDGWIAALNCPIETKHVGGREPFEVIVDRYQPQMQWQMECTNANQCALSVIAGANEPLVEFVQKDAEYAAEMMMRGEQFMHFVWQKLPPVRLEAVPPPVDATKVIDMTGNNQWAAHADEWLRNWDAVAVAKEAEKVLKSLVPADAKKCHGHQIVITRDRAGRLSLREIRE